MLDNSTLPLQPTALLFDLDGTLIDSAVELHQALNRLLDEYQKPPIAIQAIRAHLNEGVKGFVALGFPEIKNKTTLKYFYKKYLDYYFECVEKNTSHFFEGIESLLKTLMELKFPCGIVTNKSERFAHPIVAKNPCLALMQTVVCGDHVSQGKPAPDSLLLACQQMGMDPKNCCYVGDSLIDLNAAQKAKMPSILACWGYWPFLGIDISLWPATAKLHHPNEVLSLILSP